MQTSAEIVEEHHGGAPERTSPADGDRAPEWFLRAAAGFDRLRTRRWFWPAALAVGYVLEVLFRLSLVKGLSFPTVHPDEDSYLVLSRALAGRATTEIPVGEVIPGGYPLLISPALRLTTDPVLAYQLVLGLNALMNALVFPLAYVALRRLGVRRLLAYVFGGVTALLPPVIFYSQYAMSDVVLPVLILSWVLCMHGWLTEGPLKRRAWYAVGMSAAAGYSMATHDRGGVVVALTAVVLLGVLVLRWAPWRATVLGLVVLGGGVGFAKGLNWWLTQHYTAGKSKVSDHLIEGLTNGDILQRTLTRTIGQIWYFIVSTWGISGLAVVICTVAVFSGRFRRQDRIVGGVMVALLVGTAFAAAATLPDDGRIDDWVYARYTSYLIPSLFLTGVAVFVRFTRKRVVYTALATAALVLALAQGVILSAGADLRNQIFVLWGMPDVTFLAGDWSKLNMMRATAAAFVILAGLVLLLVSGGRKVLWALGVSLALFACFANVTITEHVTTPFAKWRKSTATGFTKAAGIKPGDNVAISWNVDWGLRATQSYMIYPGRVWYRDPLWQEIPDKANVIITPAPAAGATPESYWPNHPLKWQVDRVDTKAGWMIWRKH